jgi:hypothetical protein
MMAHLHLVMRNFESDLQHSEYHQSGGDDLNHGANSAFHFTTIGLETVAGNG